MVFGIHLYKELNVIKASGIRTVVGASGLRHYLAHFRKSLQTLAQVVGYAHALLKRDTLRQRGPDIYRPLVHLGQELRTKQIIARQATHHSQQSHSDGLARMAVTKGKEAIKQAIYTSQKAVGLFLNIMLEQHSGEHRHKGECKHQSTQQSEAQRISERREHLALYFLKREDGQKGRDDDKFGEEHRLGLRSCRYSHKAVLAHFVERGHAHPACLAVEGHKDGLNHDHGTVYDNAKINGAHRQEVGTHVVEVKTHKGKEQRKRYDRSHNEGGAPVAHEEEHHQSD